MFLESMPYVWLAVAIVLFVIEAVTIGLTIIWFAIGAVAGLLLALLGAPLWLQITGFIVVSGLVLWLVRPIVQKRLLRNKVSTNFDMVIGKQGIVEKDIDNDLPTGLVRVLGQDWTARSLTGAPIARGTRIEVVNVQGVKAFVRPVAEIQTVNPAPDVQPAAVK